MPAARKMPAWNARSASVNRSGRSFPAAIASRASSLPLVAPYCAASRPVGRLTARLWPAPQPGSGAVQRCGRLRTATATGPGREGSRSAGTGQKCPGWAGHRSCPWRRGHAAPLAQRYGSPQTPAEQLGVYGVPRLHLAGQDAARQRGGGEPVQPSIDSLRPSLLEDGQYVCSRSRSCASFLTSSHIIC